MKPRLFFPLAVVLSAIASVVATSAFAQTVGAGPYYAKPSWDQKLQCDYQVTCPRFIVLSNWDNNAVLDRETGLVWERSPSTTTFNWNDAHLHCNRLDVGNRRGWRLPTIQELGSLVDPTGPIPALPPGHPFANVESSYGSAYWSATTYALDAISAWSQSFFVPGLAFVGGNAKGNFANVWCVRGGQGVDPQ